MVKAAIDVGSNSVLLLVELFEGGRWKVLAETSEVTGLGSGTKTTGIINDVAMANTLAALARAYRTAEELGATEVVAGGTMALRLASNADEFLTQAKQQDTPVRVISGDEEAQLGFDAVANDPTFAQFRRLSIVDPGGHSTELMTADRLGDGAWNVTFRRSYFVGALGLRDGLLSDESPPPPARLNAVREIDDHIGLEYLPDECGRVVVLGATGTNLATIRQKLTKWNPDKVHGEVFSYEEVGSSVGWMFDLDDAGRAAIVGIEPGRERTLHIGCLILERFMYALRAESCVVSARGWRHALLERR